MEAKEFQGIISIYDSYTINELIKAIKAAREEVESFNQKESEIKEEKKAKGKDISDEEKSEYNEKIQKVKEERKPIKAYLSKLERKKNGLLVRLDKKIKEIEVQNGDMQKEIEQNKELINSENSGLEVIGLSQTQGLKDYVSNLETKINKNVEKLNKLYRIFSDVKDENIVEGLQKAIVRTYKRLQKDQIFKSSNESMVESNLKNGSEEMKEVKEEQEEKDMLTLEQIEIARLEVEIKKSAERMKEYKENGNYNQEALEHQYYTSLVTKVNELKNPTKEEEKKEEKDVLTPEQKEIARLEEELKKSAERMKEYKENGNYDQEAAEYQYYTSLVTKVNELKNPTKEELKEEPKDNKLTPDEISNLLDELLADQPKLRVIRKNDATKTNDTNKSKGKKISLLEKIKGFFKNIINNIKGIKMIGEGKQVAPSEKTSKTTQTSQKETQKTAENTFKDYYRVDEKWVENKDGLQIPIELLGDDAWIINKEGLHTPKAVLTKDEEETR